MARFKSENIFSGSDVEGEEWIPEALDGRADFKRENRGPVPPKNTVGNPEVAGHTRRSKKPIPSKLKEDPSSPGLKTWMPATRISKDDSRIMERGKVEGKDNRAAAKVARTGAAVHMNPAEISRSVDPIFRETVTANAIHSVDLLRRWYWEKEDHAKKKGGVYSISSRDRIFVILLSLGKNLLERIYSIMTPTERRQFHEILKKPPALSAAKIMEIRREFLRALESTEL